MRRHLDLLGTLFIVYPLVHLGAAVTAFAMVAASGLLELPPAREAALALLDPVAVMVLGAFLFGGLFFAAFVVVGRGIHRRRPWSRPAAMALGACVVLNLPLGTLLGLFTFLVMTHADVVAEYVDHAGPARGSVRSNGGGSTSASLRPPST